MLLRIMLKGVSNMGAGVEKRHFSIKRNTNSYIF